MAKKSVYLFSTVILGFSLAPISVWGDEITEPTVNNVTTELIEIPSDGSPVAGVEAEQSIEPATAAETTEQTSEIAPTEPVSEINTEVPEYSETPELPVEPAKAVEEDSIAEEAQPLEEQEPAPPTEPEITEAAQPEPTVAAVSTRAAKTALKNDYDGKIVDHNKAITDETTKIPDAYDFMPNFANVKDIVIGGTKNYTTDGYSYVFDLDTEKPNTITVTYKNVGTYNGKVIDMRITVKGWTALAGRQVLYINKDNGITMKGISDVLLNYAFLDQLTASPVKLSGFFNFTDIDFEQSIDLFNNNNIQNFYVTKNNQLYFKVHNDYIKIGEINNQKTNHYDMRYWLTYTYKNVSNFDVRYNQDYETDAVFNYSFKLPLSMNAPGFVDPTIPLDVEMPDELNPAANTNQEPAANPNLTSGKTTEAASSLPESAEREKIPVAQATQTELPKTNEQFSSVFTLIGGACIFLFTALFLNKKKA